jgi:hypothetical protein
VYGSEFSCAGTVPHIDTSDPGFEYNVEWDNGYKNCYPLCSLVGIYNVDEEATDALIVEDTVEDTADIEVATDYGVLPAVGALKSMDDLVFGNLYLYEGEVVVYTGLDEADGYCFRNEKDNLAFYTTDKTEIVRAFPEAEPTPEYTMPEEGALIRVTAKVDHDGKREECLFIGYVEDVQTECVVHPALMMRDLITDTPIYLMRPEYTLVPEVE